MSLLNQLDTAYNSKVSSIYAVKALKLRPYVNTVEVFETYPTSKTLLLKSECGTGKIFSLKKLKETGKTIL